MFNIGPGELVVILILALILLGPEKLPEAARTVGKGMRELQRATRELRDTVETELYKLEEDGAVGKHVAAKPVVSSASGSQPVEANSSRPIPSAAPGAVAQLPPPAPVEPLAPPAPGDEPKA